MSDHLHDAVTVLVTLDLPSLCRAARLGGLPIALDENPMEDTETSLEIVRHYAKRGILASIHESFDRAYPAHYPDDVRDAPETAWTLGGADIDYRWGHIWRRTAQW